MMISSTHNYFIVAVVRECIEHNYGKVYIYIYIFIYKQLNRDLLNESFHVCAEHSTIIRSITTFM